MNVGMQHIAIKAPFEMQLVVPVLDFVWGFFFFCVPLEVSCWLVRLWLHHTR